MGDSVDGVRALDVKIAATEEEFERLRQLLAEAESNLQVLRRARALLVGDEGQARPDRREQAREAPSLPREETTDEELSAAPRSAVGTVAGPIATIILDVMREAGKPLPTTELIERLRARGKNVEPATITNAVALLVKEGKLWRTAPRTFGLPKGVSL